MALDLVPVGGGGAGQPVDVAPHGLASLPGSRDRLDIRLRGITVDPLPQLGEVLIHRDEPLVYVLAERIAALVRVGGDPKLVGSFLDGAGGMVGGSVDLVTRILRGIADLVARVLRGIAGLVSRVLRGGLGLDGPLVNRSTGVACGLDAVG